MIREYTIKSFFDGWDDWGRMRDIVLNHNDPLNELMIKFTQEIENHIYNLNLTSIKLTWADEVMLENRKNLRREQWLCRIEGSETEHMLLKLALGF